ncbi:MAG: hypothetical protein WC506_00700 [Candidatus Micrarchaeia archaeon]
MEKKFAIASALLLASMLVLLGCTGTGDDSGTGSSDSGTVDSGSMPQDGGMGGFGGDMPPDMPEGGFDGGPGGDMGAPPG